LFKPKRQNCEKIGLPTKDLANQRIDVLEKASAYLDSVDNTIPKNADGNFEGFSFEVETQLVGNDDGTIFNKINVKVTLKHKESSQAFLVSNGYVNQKNFLVNAILQKPPQKQKAVRMVI